MQHLLKQHEIQYLSEHFRFSPKAMIKQKGSVHAADLLDLDKCRSYLDDVSDIIQSPCRIVSASQFSKKYSYLIIVPGLYTLTVFNKGLNLSIENVHVVSLSADQKWLPSIHLLKQHVMHTEGKIREQWRNEVFKTIFSQNLSRMWNLLSHVVNISPAVLWENTAIYVYWLYEKRMEQESNPQVRLRIKEDFNYLLYEAPSTLFGEPENPLKKYFVKKSNNQDIRTRKTCCYYYRLTSHKEYCSTCPRART